MSFAKYTAVGLIVGNFNERHIKAAAALTPGDFYQLADGLVGFYAGLEAASVNDLVTYYMSGVFDVLCNATTDTYVDGVAVYWDTVNKVAVTAASATCVYMGTAVGAKLTGATRVRVALNGNIAPSLSAAATATSLTVSGATTLSGACSVGTTLAVGGASTFTGAINVNQTSKVSNTKYLDIGWATLAAGATGAKAQIVSQTVYLTCASASDVFAKLPAPVAGRMITVCNNSAQTADIYPNAAETINNTTHVTIATYKAATFVSDGTNWIAHVGA